MRDEQCAVRAKGDREVLEEQRVRRGMGENGEHHQSASNRLA